MREVAKLSAFILLIIGTIGFLVNEFVFDWGKVVAVKPRLESEPFFKLSYDCHAKDIAGDPEGLWVHKSKMLILWKFCVHTFMRVMYHQKRF